MMHRDFGEAESSILKFLHQLQADRSVRRFQIDHIKDRPTQQAEIAINIAQLETKHQLHEMMIEAPDNDAVHRIGAADLIAVHNVDPWLHLRHQQLEFAWVILRVAIGIKDQILGRRSKADAQRATVSQAFLHSAAL